LKLLAFDTSTEMCSVAVHHDGAWLTSDMHVGNRHSELLLPAIGALLAEAGLDLRQLQGIAYGMGPGSFTGLRIGCGVAQGLALGADLPVLGVVTLEAMAWQADADWVLVGLDARMHEVYYAAYRRAAGALRAVVAPCVAAPDAVPLPDGDGWLARGNAWRSYAEPLAARLAGRVARLETDAWPSAKAIAELALPRFAAGEAVAPEHAEPFYVRDKVALKTSERPAR
jgi:tRNA threonylcarbamoyladenosine biosynthesis protein TsaB